MKLKMLFLFFSIGFICCILAHNVTNHTIPCDSDRWSGLSGGSVENGVLTAAEGAEGRVMETFYYSLDKGDYRVAVKFHSSAPGAELNVETFDCPLMTVELPAGEGIKELEIPVSLDRDSVDFRLYINKPIGGALVIWEIDITSEGLVNQDYTYLAVVSAIVLALLYYLIFLNRNHISPETVFSVLLLLAVCILISAPMFRTGMYDGDDQRYHIYKIEGMRDGIKNGQFPVYFLPYVFSGYGYLNALYPNMFFYPVVLLRILGVSSMTCYKTLFFAASLATAWIAYWAAKRLLGKERRWAPLLFALLWVLAPYRINNLWVRSAAGELLAMAFLPLVAVGLYELLAGDRKKWWYLAIGYSGLIQSHVLSCLLVLMFSVAVGIFYADVFLKEKRWIELLKVIGCLLAFNAWYLIPFLVYMRLDLDLSKLQMDWYDHSMALAEIFQSHIGRLPGRYFWRSNSLGIAGTICLILGAAGIVSQRKKDKRQKFLSVLFFCGLIFMVLMTNLVPWELLKQSALIDWVTETMQFPWRFLAFVSLCLLLAGVEWLYQDKKLDGYRPMVCALLLLAAVLSMWDIVNETARRGGYTPQDRPLVSRAPEYVMAGSDYTDFKRMIYLSDEEKVEVQDYILETSKATVWLVCREEGQYIEAPMFHYPGYKAFDRNGTRLPTETGSNNRVRVPLSPSSEVQEITVRFTGEDIFRVGYGITLAAVIWAAVYCNRERLRRLGNRRDIHL